ncbi:MAG: transporter substrate-binding domain-containing protein [Thermodesulfobacteriota bacterium]|nr:transporter substrate-binding domain-containing protein [Thermodesulfobacteriota bacterium]
MKKIRSFITGRRYIQGIKRKLFLSTILAFIFILTIAFFSIATAGQPGEDSQIQLTEGERDWLSAHPVIRIAPDPYFPPIEYFDKNGNYTGIAADYIAILEEKLGIKFKVVRCKSWNEVLEKARTRRADVLPAAAQTPERSQYVLFCDPHIILPGVIITRKKAEGTMDMEKIRGMKVSVVKSYVWQEFIQADYPDIDLDLVPDLQSGLRKVSLGGSDALVATLPVAIYYIEREGITNLRVAGETGYFTRLSFASRKDWPEFNSIVRKALNQISSDEKKAILNKWVHLGQESFFKSSKFLGILLTSLLQVIFVLMLILIWRYYQKKFLQLYPEEKAASLNIVFFVAAMFILLGVVVWLNELLDIPCIILGVSKTSINYGEAFFETVLVYLLGVATVFFLVRNLNARKRIEESLRKSETRYRLLAENVADVIWTVDMDLRFDYISPSVFGLMGYTPEEFMDMTLDGYMTSASLELCYKAFEEELALEASGRADPDRTRVLELEHICKNGSIVWVEMNMSPLRDADGRWTRILGVTRDITDRRRAKEQINQSLKEKEILLRELHHRVNNNMQMILSMLSMQSQKISDEKTLNVLKALEGRIRSVSIIHEKIYRSKDISTINFREYIDSLASYLYQTHRVNSNLIKFTPNVDDILFEMETSIPLGIIVRELLSNALTHAFPEGEKGEISVDLHSDETTGRYTLIISDNGAGIPEDMNIRDTETIGLQLVNDLSNQIGGTIELDRSRGTLFKIIFTKQEYRKRI